MKQLLKWSSGGTKRISQNKYGGFEWVVSIGSILPSADSRITTNPGMCWVIMNYLMKTKSG